MLRNFFLRAWPIFLIFLLVFIFFWKFFLKGLLPIPADIVVGLYYPWLDYKWGYAVGVPVKNPLLSDVVSVIYFLRSQVADIFQNGNFPFWNNYSFSGYPLFANPQAAVVYPLNIFYLFLPKSLAWSLQVILQPLLAGISMYLYLKFILKATFSSLFGAIAFAFSGFVIIFLEYNVHAHTIIFLPLLFLSIEKIFSEKRLCWGVIFSFLLGAQILAGYPQITFYSLLALLLYVIFKRNLQLTFFFILFSFLGMALVAFYLIPAVEFLNLSQRVYEGSQEGLAFLPWQEIVNFFIPDFFGNPATANFWGEGNYTNLVGYTGIISLILASISLKRIRENNFVLFFFFLLFLSLLLALPTPFSSFFGEIKILGLGAASATRVLFLANFSISVLGAYGLETLYKRKLKDRKFQVRPAEITRILFLFMAILLGITLGVFIAREIFVYYGNSFQYNEESLKIIETWKTNLNVAIRNTILPFIFVFSMAITALLAGKIRKIEKAWLWMVFIFLIAELFRFGWKYTPFTKKEILFPKTPVIEFLINQKKPFRILGGDVIPMNMWAAFGLESPAGYDAVYPLRYAQFLNVANGGKVEDSVSRYGDIKRFDSPLIDLTNTKYILALKYDRSGHVDQKGNISYKFQLPKFKPVFEDKSVVVLENTQVLPRAFLVYDYQVENEGDKIFKTLLDPKFDLRKKIVLEESVDRTLKEGNVKGVSYLEEITGESKVLVDHDGDGLLFVSDSYYPGWRAYLDGKETKIYRANYTFRAVFVPSGKHMIDFIYKPRSFRIGLIISLASLALLPGIFIYEAKRIN